MFSESVVKDFIVLTAVASAGILTLKFLTLHVFGNLAPSGVKTAVAAI